MTSIWLKGDALWDRMDRAGPWRRFANVWNVSRPLSIPLASHSPSRAATPFESGSPRLTKPPFERELREVEGTLVGIFAVDAAGALTHHDSSMHVHVVLDGVDGEWTGHCEKVGVGEGAVLRLPGM